MCANTRKRILLLQITICPYLYAYYESRIIFFQSSGDNWFLEDETGKQLPALVVYAESLRYLKQSLLEEANKQYTDIVVDNIKWILTVPAICSDPANAFMRRAAIGVCAWILTYS